MQALNDILTKFRVFIIDPIILVVFAAGFCLFIFGLVEFLWALNDDARGQRHEKGRQHMIWGIVGMLIMISVYGIISLLDNTFSLGVFSGPDVSRMDAITQPFK